MKKHAKKLLDKGMCFAMGALPVLLTGLLIIHTNSAASGINGQPVPPKNLKKYRKF